MDHDVDWLSNPDHPLSEIFYHDYLVLDLSKPFTKQGFMDIEKSMFAGRSHQTSGDRWLGEDVIDELMT